MEAVVAEVDPSIAAKIYDLRVQRLEIVVAELRNADSIGCALTSGGDWRSEEPELLSEFMEQSSRTIRETGEIQALVDESRRLFNASREEEIIRLHQRFYCCQR